MADDKQDLLLLLFSDVEPSEDRLGDTHAIHVMPFDAFGLADVV